MQRAAAGELLSTEMFDVAVIGGGINGACLFDQLRRRGYRVALVDAGDFGSGTSSESGMMVWGGLLYLRQFDVRTVVSLCRARDRMIRQLGSVVSPTRFRYCVAQRRQLQAAIVAIGLYLYWGLGGFRRARPRILKRIREREWISDDAAFLEYEEAFLSISDARFVLSWICPHELPDAVAMNYCEVESSRYDRSNRHWQLAVKDRIGGAESMLRSRTVVNCAGIWTDRVNAVAGIETPYRHAFSKGVYVAFDRPTGHDVPLIFEQGEHGDVLTSVPWGPIALWGPTETQVDDIESGFTPDVEDVRFLLKHRERCLELPSGPENIVSLRCGMRPLAVDRNFVADRYTLELSRRHRTVADRHVPWVSTFGGKLTGCVDAAIEASECIAAMTAPTGKAFVPREALRDTTLARFPGMPDALPSVEWCVAHEHCCTLDDYLRRRTNISQWVPREGLGQGNCHGASVRDVCVQLCGGDEVRAASMYQRHSDDVATRFDGLLSSI
jgi:glycerol-3-phosphate dehydrogenase